MGLVVVFFVVAGRCEAGDETGQESRSLPMNRG
jgi:hypothetical protein